MRRITMEAVPYALGILGLCAAHAALAVEPANLELGAVNITPTLDVRGQYTDNFFRSHRDEVDTWALITTGRLRGWMENGPSTYSLGYRFKDYIYASSHDDDFTDQYVTLDIYQEFNARNRLEVDGEYYDGHEQRGTGLTEGEIYLLADEPVELERTTLGGAYTYGSREAHGRLELGARYRDMEYQNFRNVTQYRDYDKYTYHGTFYWRVAPRTDALAEVRYSEVEYDRDNPLDTSGTLDSETMYYLVGLNWLATAKTSGSIRAGMFDREYDSDARNDNDGFHWEADITWRPRSYSRFTFLASREIRETNGLGDGIDTQEFQVGWDHDWSSRSRTNLELMLATDDYTGARREDDRIRFDAAYYYALYRWFDIGAGYRYEERDSNERKDLDFDANFYFIEAKLSL